MTNLLNLALNHHVGFLNLPSLLDFNDPLLPVCFATSFHDVS